MPPGQTGILRLTFSNPNRVTMSSDPMVRGNWTMVYDEGFEVGWPDAVMPLG